MKYLLNSINKPRSVLVSVVILFLVSVVVTMPVASAETRDNAKPKKGYSLIPPSVKVIGRPGEIFTQKFVIGRMDDSLDEEYSLTLSGDVASSVSLQSNLLSVPKGQKQSTLAFSITIPNLPAGKYEARLQFTPNSIYGYTSDNIPIVFATVGRIKIEVVPPKFNMTYVLATLSAVLVFVATLFMMLKRRKRRIVHTF